MKDASRSVPDARPRCSPTSSAPSCWPTSRRTTTRCARGTRPSTTGRCSRSRQARANRDPDRLGRLRRRRRPSEPGVHVLRGLRHRRAARLHRLAAVLQRLGDEGQVPRHPQQPDDRRDRAQALRRRAGDARPDHRGEVADRQRRLRLLPGRRRSATTSSVYTDESRTEVLDDPAPPAPAGRAPRGRPQPVAGRLRRAAGDRASPTTSARSPSRPASAAHDKIKEFKADMDDYYAILLEALADRLAEAFAERMHQRVRTEFWGYAPTRHLDNEDLIAEKYVGIRPAPGYPACPDHTEKPTLWELLDVEENDRHRAHRVDGHVAGRVGVAAGTSRTRSRSTSSSVASAATRSRTTPSARAGPWPRPSAGCRPTWATTRRTEPGAWRAPRPDPPSRRRPSRSWPG